MTDEPTPIARPRPPTIRDVAERAGVSKSLVSLVLQEAPHVSDTRRQVVLEAIAELGYRPNSHARGLARTSTDTVGILLNDLRNPWFVELVTGLSATLHSAGLGTVIADSRTDQLVGRRSVDTLVRQGVDGIVVVGTTSEPEAIRQASESIPVILAGTRDPDLPTVDIVVDDDREGARAATNHLIELGHRRIAHLAGPDEIGRLRLDGFQSAMLEAGLDPERFVESGGRTEEAGYAAARRLFAAEDRPTAVFAFNDLSAIGVLSAASDERLSVPHDVSVVGYDNSALAQVRHISLTSVDNGSFAVGVQAGSFLLERLRQPLRLQRLHLVSTSLVVRGTSAAPARQGSRDVM